MEEVPFCKFSLLMKVVRKRVFEIVFLVNWKCDLFHRIASATLRNNTVSRTCQIYSTFPVIFSSGCDVVFSFFAVCLHIFHFEPIFEPYLWLEAALPSPCFLHFPFICPSFCLFFNVQPSLCCSRLGEAFENERK